MPMSLARWPRCPQCGRFFANPDHEVCASRLCPPPLPEVHARLDGEYVTLTVAQPEGSKAVIVCRTFEDVRDGLRAATRLTGSSPIQES